MQFQQLRNIIKSYAIWSHQNIVDKDLSLLVCCNI